MLGVSAGAAYAMAGKIMGQGAVVPKAAAQTPKKGGTLRYAMRVQEMSDPATFDWVPKANVARQITEYLVRTGADNITRPYLAESWEASDDLKTWTFKLRQGIKWSNGDDFGADDVVFNFKRWTDPATGSSNIGLFSSMVEEYDSGKKDDNGKPIMSKKMTDGAVEKIDDHTVRLNLNSAVLSIPENLYNYPTAIVNRRFSDDGGDLSKNPVGTGPYRLAKFSVGEEVVLVKRDPSEYWGEEVLLDQIKYIDFGDDASARVAALASGQADIIHELSVAQLDVIKRLPGIVLHQAVTAQTAVARMQVDQEPFTNKKVRQAVQACIDHDSLLELAYRGLGATAEDHHVSPIHPEYFKLPERKQDIDRAKALLKEAGHPNGLKLKIDLNANQAWEVAAAQAMREMWLKAGIDVTLNVLPGAQFWGIWDKTPFGLTGWTHRPLGVMVLNLGYRGGVPWNESHYNSAEFDAALDDASGTLDVNERRKKMEKVESILQGDAVISQTLWRSVFKAAHERVKNYQAHPTLYHQLQKVWLA
jgi:peptide/nickel transport system substrate-binding protein